MTNPDTDEARALLGPPSIYDPSRFGTAIGYDQALEKVSAALTRAREAEAQISTLTEERNAAQAEIAALREALANCVNFEISSDRKISEETAEWVALKRRARAALAGEK